MDESLPSDHETELRRQFEARRGDFLRLAREYPAAMRAVQLDALVRQNDALQALRTKWQASSDPRDLGEPAE